VNLLRSFGRLSGGVLGPKSEAQVPTKRDIEVLTGHLLKVVSNNARMAWITFSVAATLAATLMVMMILGKQDAVSVTSLSTATLGVIGFMARFWFTKVRIEVLVVMLPGIDRSQALDILERVLFRASVIKEMVGQIDKKR